MNIKTITQEDLEEAMFESVDAWDMKTLIIFAVDALIEEASKDKYVVVSKYEGEPARYEYSTMCDDTDDLGDDEMTLYEVDNSR